MASGRLAYSDRGDFSGRAAAPRRVAVRARGPDQPALARGRGIAGHAPRRDVVRPDPRDLRRALSRRSRSAAPVPGAARARARGRPRARDLARRRPRTPSSACTFPTTGSWSWARRRRAAYTRPAAGTDALAAARAAVAGLEERFVLYTAGMDDRKNFQGLFRAWARLPAAVRDRWQLVMVCSMDDPTRNHLVHLARAAGIEARLLASGVRARRGVAAAVPVDRPVRVPFAVRGVRAAGRRSARVRRAHDRLRHLVGRRAARCRGAVRSGERRRDRGGDRPRADRRRRRARFSTSRRANRCRDGMRWPTASPARTTGCLARPSPAARRRPRVAFVTPLPPAPSGVADFSFRLLDGAARVLRRARVRRRLPARGSRSSGHPARPTVSRCSRCDTSSTTNGHAVATTASCTASATASSTPGALAQLRRRSGVVLAHEVRLTDLYALSADEPGAVPGGFAACLEAMYDDLPAGTGAAGRLDARRVGADRRAHGGGGGHAGRSVRRDVAFRRRPRAPRGRSRRIGPHLRAAVRGARRERARDARRRRGSRSSRASGS